MGSYFLTADHGWLAPAPEARSPWSADMLHGRLLAGLAARAVEREATPSGFRLTRLTVDLFRAAPMEPLRLATTVARDGGRVRAVDVTIESGEIEVARGRALLLREGTSPEATPWRPPRWEVPPPSDVAPGPSGGGWDIRPINPGGFWSDARKQVWMRDTWELVGGEPPSPSVRAALAADLPNPMANASARGLEFINADLTLSLGRLPESEWIGLEVAGQAGGDGLAVGLCTMHDAEGAIGWSSVCALATAPMD
jgi:hypothetical protein